MSNTMTYEEFKGFVANLPNEKKNFESDYGCEMSDEQAVDWAKMIVDSDSRIQNYMDENMSCTDAVYWIAEAIFETDPLNLVLGKHLEESVESFDDIEAELACLGMKP